MRKEKELFLDEVCNHIEGSPDFIVISYDRLSCADFKALRSQISECGGYLEVVRKRLFAEAMKKRGMQITSELLKGHISVAFSFSGHGRNKYDALIAQAKCLLDFKGRKEATLEVVGGVLDHSFLPPGEVKMFANLPSQQELRSQILSVLSAPMSGLLSVQERLVASVPSCIESYLEKLESGE